MADLQSFWGVSSAYLSNCDYVKDIIHILHIACRQMIMDII